MRTMLRTVWFWFCGVFLLNMGGWKGATPGWSPKASVAATGGPAAWDVAGWVDASQDEVHNVLDEIERQLRVALIELRESVYEWRDCYASTA